MSNPTSAPMVEEINLWQKISAVMSEVEAVAKDKRNDFHRYRYASEAAVVTAIRAALIKNGLAFYVSTTETPWSRDDGGRTQIELRFRIVDTATGRYIESTFIGEGQDSGDKGFYKAYTGAVKFFLLKTFLIPTEDDPEADPNTDRNNAEGRSAPPRPTAPRTAEPAPRPTAPRTAETTPKPATAQATLSQKVESQFGASPPSAMKPNRLYDGLKRLLDNKGISPEAFSDWLSGKYPERASVTELNDSEWAEVWRIANGPREMVRREMGLDDSTVA